MTVHMCVLNINTNPVDTTFVIIINECDILLYHIYIFSTCPLGDFWA